VYAAEERVEVAQGYTNFSICEAALWREGKELVTNKTRLVSSFSVKERRTAGMFDSMNSVVFWFATDSGLRFWM